MWYLSLCLFSFGTVISGILVITSVRAISAIISLILAFINSIGILILLGMDFLALIYCIVYVGAIAILFLFVIMLLNNKFIEVAGAGADYLTTNVSISEKVSRKTSANNKNSYYLNGGALAFLICFLYILIIWCGLIEFSLQNEWFNIIDNGKLPLIVKKSNISSLGEMLYKECGYEILLVISLILLVGMIGTIVLTI